MNSTTLVNSSLTLPDKSVTSPDITLTCGKKRYPKENTNLKTKIQETINPNNRASNSIFTLPSEWKENMYLFLTQGSPDYELSKFLDVVIKLHCYLFPDRKKGDLILIPAIKPRNHDINNGIALWFEMFSLPRSVFEEKNRLDYIKSIILKNMIGKRAKSSFFQIVCMKGKMTRRSARFFRRKLVKQHQALKPLSQVQLTIHLQDNKNPFILLWVDTENVCCFNLFKLTEFQTLADFANTLLCFINYSDYCKE